MSYGFETIRNASVVRARTIGTSVNIGALGSAACRWRSGTVDEPAAHRPTCSSSLGALALVGLAAAPETGTPNPHAKASLAVAGIQGPQRRTTRLLGDRALAGLSGSSYDL
jgi:hypothetical protein